MLKPIFFNTLMTQATMYDKKTQTRRPVKFPEGLEMNLPDGNMSIEFLGPALHLDIIDNTVYNFFCKPELYIEMKAPYVKNDLLYVRETWNYGYIERSDEELNNEHWFEPLKYNDSNIGDFLRSQSKFYYKADAEDWYDEVGMKWKPSIHMPKEAARTFLEVKNVRIERIQDMTDEDAKAEGANFDLTQPSFNVGVEEKMKRSTLERFQKIWSSITQNPNYSWKANPWVWVIDFERVEKPQLLS